MTPSTERILFLYLNTGGGHLGPAKALMAQIRETYGPEAPVLVLQDGMPGTSSFERVLVEKGYWFASTVLPFLWGMIYHGSRVPLVTGIQLWYARHHAAGHMAELIETHGITKIVNLHFLLAPPIDQALKRLNRQIPQVTVVSDPFSLHPTWSYRNPTPMVALSEQAGQTLRRRLARQGLDPGKVRVEGPVVDPKFSRRLSPDQVKEAKSRFGFDAKLPLILLAGGAGGLPRAERFLRAIAKSDLPVQVALVCGHNRSQFDRAARLIRRFPGARVRLYEFVPFMYELFSMADVILTKAGAGAVFEILSLHKPMIITSYLYGQERGNVDYVVANGYGWYAPRVAVALNRIRDLLDHPEKQVEAARRLATRVPANGTEKIARFIVEQLS